MAISKMQSKAGCVWQLAGPVQSSHKGHNITSYDSTGVISHSRKVQS